jgi:hypothetical protein
VLRGIQLSAATGGPPGTGKDPGQRSTTRWLWTARPPAESAAAKVPRSVTLTTSRSALARRDQPLHRSCRPPDGAVVNSGTSLPCELAVQCKAPPHRRRGGASRRCCTGESRSCPERQMPAGARLVSSGRPSRRPPVGRKLPETQIRSSKVAARYWVKRD